MLALKRQMEELGLQVKHEILRVHSFSAIAPLHVGPHLTQ